MTAASSPPKNTDRVPSSRTISARNDPGQRTTLSPRTIALEMVIFLAVPAYSTMRTFSHWDDPTAHFVPPRSLGDAVSGAATSLMICYLIWRDKGSLASMGLARVRIGKEALIAAFMLLALVAQWRITAPLTSTMGAMHRSLSYAWPLHPWGKAAFVVSFFISAFHEEFLFRGYLLSRLDDLRVNRFSAVVGAAAFFAAGHSGPGAAVSAFVTGLTFGTAFLGWRSLVGLGIAHGAWNLLVEALSS